MAFNIADFQEALAAQGARPNLFEMSITGASGITGAATADFTGGQFKHLCKTAQLPGSTIGVVEVQYFGRPVKMPGNRTFENLTTTIINDEGFKLRHALEKWMSFLNTHEGNLSTTAGGTSLTYTGTLTLQQYSRDGAADINPYKFNRCWPVNVAPIDLDWGTNDTIEEFTVEWAYDWWSNDTSAST